MNTPNSTAGQDAAVIQVFKSKDIAPLVKDVIQKDVADGDGFWVLHVKNASAFQGAAAKRRHNLRGALRTLQLATEAIAGGYRFNDDTAQLKIATMQSAIATLEKEVRFVEPLFSDQ